MQPILCLVGLSVVMIAWSMLGGSAPAPLRSSGALFAATTRRIDISREPFTPDVARCEFPFRNVSSCEIRLRAGGTSCTCASLHVPDHPVAPGESEVVVMTVTLRHRQGNFRARAQIFVSDHEPAIDLTVEGVIPRPLRLRPDTVLFDTTTRGHAREVVLVADRESDWCRRPITITSSHAALHAEITAQHGSESGTEGCAIIRLMLDDSALDIGPFRGFVRLQSISGEQAIIQAHRRMDTPRNPPSPDHR
jgi:hypothetical protein